MYLEEEEEFEDRWLALVRKLSRQKEVGDSGKRAPPLYSLSCSSQCRLYHSVATEIKYDERDKVNKKVSVTLCNLDSRIMENSGTQIITLTYGGMFLKLVYPFYKVIWFIGFV